jgi:PAS domain S-box-containing protein
MDHPKFFASLPVRKKLLLLLIVVFLPAFGIIVATGLNQRKEEIARLQDDALLVVQSLAARQEEISVTARTLLSTLAQLPAVRRLDAKACNKLFRELHARYPFYSVILAASSDGSVFAASMPFERMSVNLSDGKQFRDTVSTLDFPAGENIGGKDSDVPSLSFAMPVLDGSGKPIGVVMVGFNLREYASFVSKVNLPEGYAITIADYKGIRLLRLPENDVVAPGSRIASDAFTRVSGNLNQGSYEVAGQDGIERIYAFKQLRLREGLPPYLYMIAGMAKGRILHRESLQMVRNLSILAIAALMTLSLGWVFGNSILVRPMRQLVASVQRFGKGEMNARTGVPHTADELGRLASAFDNMASQLERKNREREDAERALSEAYAQLETRVQERTAELSASNAALTMEVGERARAERALRETEERYRVAIEHSNDGVALGWGDRYIYANRRFLEMFGYESLEEVLGKESSLVAHPDDRGKLAEHARKRRENEPVPRYQFKGIRKDGATIYVEASVADVMFLDQSVGLAYVRDVTERKWAEEALQEREKELEKKSASLEEANTALKVLLKHRDEDTKALENTILANVKELVLPYVERLGRGQLSDTQKTHLSMIESSLNDIVSPFLQKMASAYAHFTPTEVQIADLIKSGKTSKEIAELMNVCTGTVDAHRNNIRSKLGISKKNVNLRTHLLSM